MCKRIFFKNLKTIYDLKNYGYTSKDVNREKIRICIIDDNGFESDEFKLTGYKNVSVKTKYEEINDFECYDIIACDINGVGEKLNKKKQGISVAETIKQKYPNKVVLIYSSNDPREFDEDYKIAVDGFFKKDQSMDEIAKIFDSKAKIFSDASFAWKNLEKELKKQGVSNKAIAYIEDMYVSSILKKVNLFKMDDDKMLKLLGISFNVAKLVTTVISFLV